MQKILCVIFPFLLCHLEVAGVFRSSLVVFERLHSQRVISSLKKTTTKFKNKTTQQSHIYNFLTSNTEMSSFL